MPADRGYFIGRLFGRRSAARRAESDADPRAIVERLRAGGARYDGLTGLYKARLISQILDALESRGLREQSSLISIDIIGLRDEVAVHGSVVGDGILIALAGRLLNVIDEDAAAVRLSFSEFAVVLPGVPCEDAAEVISRIHAALDSPVGVAGTAKRIPFRIGVGSLHDSPRDSILDPA